jgi:hypothetical protein
MTPRRVQLVAARVRGARRAGAAALLAAAEAEARRLLAGADRALTRAEERAGNAVRCQTDPAAAGIADALERAIRDLRAALAEGGAS